MVGQYRGTEAVEQVPMKTCQIELFLSKISDFMDKDYFLYSLTFSVLRPYSQHFIFSYLMDLIS